MRPLEYLGCRMEITYRVLRSPEGATPGRHFDALIKASAQVVE